MKALTIILALIASFLFIKVCTNWIDLSVPLFENINAYSSDSSSTADLHHASSDETVNSSSIGTVFQIVQKIVMLFVVITFIAWVFMLLNDIKMTRKK